MRIYGLDFTSTPTPRKPITCAVGVFEENTLTVQESSCFPDFSGFETFLKSDGPWIAGLDFPFGQAAKLIQNMKWGSTWEHYVSLISKQSMQDFAQRLETYRTPRSKGDKQHLRITDEYAGSRSPMMMFGVPVGRMFFQGAPRLLESGVSVLPCHPTASNRIVVEAYPKLVARKWIGAGSYKSDISEKQASTQHEQRQKIVEGIRLEGEKHYGFHLALSDDLANAVIGNQSGDALDAVLCAIQAAWAYARRESDFGIPADCNPLEGWIVDPDCLAHKVQQQWTPASNGFYADFENGRGAVTNEVAYQFLGWLAYENLVTKITKLPNCADDTALQVADIGCYLGAST